MCTLDTENLACDSVKCQNKWQETFIWTGEVKKKKKPEIYHLSIFTRNFPFSFQTNVDKYIQSQKCISGKYDPFLFTWTEMDIMEQNDQHERGHQYLGHDEVQAPLRTDWLSRRHTWSNIRQDSQPSSMWSSWVKPMGTSMRANLKGDFFSHPSRNNLSTVWKTNKKWNDGHGRISFLFLTAQNGVLTLEVLS